MDFRLIKSVLQGLCSVHPYSYWWEGWPVAAGEFKLRLGTFTLLIWWQLMHHYQAARLFKWWHEALLVFGCLFFYLGEAFLLLLKWCFKELNHRLHLSSRSLLIFGAYHLMLNLLQQCSLNYFFRLPCKNFEARFRNIFWFSVVPHTQNSIFLFKLIIIVIIFDLTCDRFFLLCGNFYVTSDL